jgi:hypothetical protein
MSLDYWSLSAAMPPAEATSAMKALARRQVCGAIIGPDEDTLLPGWRGSAEVHVAAMASRFRGEPPAAGYWESAAVPLPEEWLERLPLDTVIMTNRCSVLSGLDRVLALPHGVALLRGHALRHVPCTELPKLTDSLDSLWKKLGGTTTAAATLQAHLFGNANEGAAADLIDRLRSALAEATGKHLDLLLLSATPP